MTGLNFEKLKGKLLVIGIFFFAFCSNILFSQVEYVPSEVRKRDSIAIKGTRITINCPLNAKYDSIFTRFIGEEYTVQFIEKLNDNLVATKHYYDSLEERYYNYWIDKGEFTTSSGIAVTYRKRLYSAAKDELIYFFGDANSSCEVLAQIPKYDGYYTRIVEGMMQSLQWNSKLPVNPINFQLFRLDKSLKDWNLINYQTNKFQYRIKPKPKQPPGKILFLEQLPNEEKMTVNDRMAKELSRWTNEGWSVMEMKLEENLQEKTVTKYALCSQVQKGETIMYFYRAVLDNGRYQLYMNVDFSDELEFPVYDFFYRSIGFQ